MKAYVTSSVGSGRPLELDFDPEETVEEFIRRVAEQELASAENMSLMMDGRELPRSKAMKEAGVRDSSALKAMPRNPVGGYENYSYLLLSPHQKNRLVRELERVKFGGIRLRPVTPLRWRGPIRGKGKWRGKTYEIEMTLPTSYPNEPPQVQFLTQPKPRHPNISPYGYVCLNILQGGWDPSYSLATVYESLEWLFLHPNNHNPVHALAEGFRGRLGRWLAE